MHRSVATTVAVLLIGDLSARRGLWCSDAVGAAQSLLSSSFVTSGGSTRLYALQENVIAADIVEEVDRSEMIPHEVYGAHFVSWSDSIFSGLRRGAVHQ
ncbi:hypothetical protein INR49_024121 [Caranx melampygus]|nr:hypothetical protein INR49_024121 [Caranx melampygus]